MAVKYLFDWGISGYFFHRPWFFSEYFLPGLLNSTFSFTSANASYYIWMLAAALPFALIGSVLTLRRLNTIGLPPWMVIFFYTPFINMIFFIVLAVVKGRPSTAMARAPDEQPAEVKSISKGHSTALALLNKMPAHRLNAFWIAALLPVPISVLAALFSVSLLGNYGWTVFTAVPFVASIAASILYGWQKPRTLAECLTCSVVCLLLMASVLLLIPFEGIICLMMASPLAVGVGLVGGFVGYLIQLNVPRNENIPQLLGCFVLILPLLTVGETEATPDFPVYENVSSIKIAAPKETVWKYLIDFPPLNPPSEWVFKTGIAYPIQAKIFGHGAGAVRHCIFTTGEFVEPIEIWNEPNLLRFSVAAQPAPMHELSLYEDLNPPHLTHYLVARQGQFLLTEIDNNHTKLEGTTWYQNYMGPNGYWRLWSDWIIHRIHMRVLNHVKNLAEHELRK